MELEQLQQACQSPDSSFMKASAVMLVAAMLAAALVAARRSRSGTGETGGCQGRGGRSYRLVRSRRKVAMLGGGSTSSSRSLL